MKAGFVLALVLDFCFGVIVEVKMIPGSGVPPTPMMSSCLASNSTESLYVFGGDTGQDSISDEVYVFNLTSTRWQQILPYKPGINYARYGAGCFVRNESVWVYGGVSGDGARNDMWKYNCLTNKWGAVSVENNFVPSVRSHFASLSIEFKGKQYFCVFGGISASGISSSLFMFDIDLLKWRQLKNGPIGLASAGMAYYKESLYIVGGLISRSSLFNQMLKFNLPLENWEILSCNQYPPRSKFSVFVIDSFLYILFGFNDNTQLPENSIYRTDLNSNCSFTQVNNPLNLSLFSYAAVKINSEIYIFSGAVPGNLTNTLIRFSPVFSNYSKITENYLSPKNLIGASLESLAGGLYLFGGLNFETAYNDLWRFDLSDFIWHKLKYYGDIPPPRAYHSSGSDGDFMVIFGGRNSVSFYNDAYSFNAITLIWSKFKLKNAQPSSRFGACMVVKVPYVYFYGGQGFSSYSVGLWWYNLSDYTWSSYDDSYGFQSCMLQGCDVSEDGEIFSLINGLSSGDLPLGFVVQFNFTSGKWNKVFQQQNLQLARSTPLIAKVGENYYIFGGSSWAYTANKEVQKIDMKHLNASVIGYMTQTAFSSAYTREASKIYFYGGGVAKGKLIRYNTPSHDFFFFDLFDVCTDDCHLVCAPGSFYNNSRCQLCPAGFYNDFYGKQSCTACPKGTFNPKEGAKSKNQCYPCSVGKYSNTEGSTHCRDCEVGYYCSIGCITPIILFETKEIESVQPVSFKRAIGEAEETSLNTQLIGTAIGTFLTLVFACLKRLRYYLVKLDLYDNLHNYEDGDLMLLKNNLIGGISTAVFYIIAFNLLIRAAVFFMIDNIDETKTLIPIMTMKEIVSSFSGNIIVDLEFHNFGGHCVDTTDNKKCAPNIFYFISEITYDISEIMCTEKDQICMLQLKLSKAEVGPSAKVLVYMQEKSLFTSHISVNVTSDSSIPDQISSVKMTAFPDENTVFRGVNPTLFQFSLTPSLYLCSYNGYQSTGYHVSEISLPIVGSYYNPHNIGFSVDLNVEIKLERSVNALKIDRNYIFTMILIALALVGSIPGAQQLIGSLMNYFEALYLGYEKKKMDRMRLEKIVRKREVTCLNFEEEERLKPLKKKQGKKRKKSQIRFNKIVPVG